MKYDKVSIIIPVFNVVNYIEHCVTSACAQTYGNIEIILVDDGSSDGSGQKCDELAEQDARVRVIHKGNHGVSAARNTGIEAALGQWICFIDGDDYVASDYVEYLLGLAQTFNAPTAVTLDVITPWKKGNQATGKNLLYTPEQATIAMLCYRFPIGVYSKIFRKDFLDANKIRFFEDLIIGEGFNFNCLVMQKAEKIAVGSHTVYYYRKDNPNSVTTKFDAQKWENGLHAINVIRENLSLENKKIMRAFLYTYWRTHTDAYDLIILSHSECKYRDMYEKTLSVTRKYALHSLSVPVSTQNKIRAIIMFIYPKIIPYLMLRRRRKHNAEVSTQGNDGAR
ncbi:glycosyltransferase family 2 protein [Bifidobacterium eulemuris]|uniref:Glycosyl transferase family 2 n=1 Tax=Bifidobacterium eulemuris TaxID=1765219 RepID=A0A261G578_9BIFI|nr:glycosyltransferase family 2 protein [Bifidobacterium eulemuris]OZG66572.1 glycosyl transferase family 2 [Bifidobacterium eulemuris]QOL32655.1 glycosyltransferase family 2 protein [Bifidobacterium eulemuris]